MYLSDSACEGGDLALNQLEILVTVHHYGKILFKTHYQLVVWCSCIVKAVMLEYAYAMAAKMVK